MTNASLSGCSVGISDSWRQWIAENKLLRASEQSMIDALVRNGIPEAVARQEVKEAPRNRICKGPSGSRRKMVRNDLPPIRFVLAMALRSAILLQRGRFDVRRLFSIEINGRRTAEVLDATGDSQWVTTS